MPGQGKPAPMAESLPLRSDRAQQPPDDYVRDLVRKAGSSFIWGMRLLPLRRRRAMYGIYAFCRAVDDIADGPADQNEKRAQLQAWRQEVELLYAGTPRHPVMRALEDAATRFELPKAEFLAVIDGMEMDARETICAPSRADFTLYCRRVAGAVGLLSVRSFGAAGRAAEELALVQGEALQIANILRDLKEDAGRGRLYVPRDLIEQAGIEISEPNAILNHPEFAQVYAALCAEAEALFLRARNLIRQADAASLRPARLMLETYYRLLLRLQSRDGPAAMTGFPCPARKSSGSSCVTG